MESQLSPARIMETATAFWPSKVLLTAVELGVFTELAAGAKTASSLAAGLEIHPTRSADFFDALVALGFLERAGDGPDGLYSNAPETDLFLDRNKPSYAGGMPEMLNARLFGFWNHLSDALRTGEPQNEAKSGENVFEMLYRDEARLEGFLGAMASTQHGNFMALAQKFPWSDYRRVLDLGGASGDLCAILAQTHPHLSLTCFDLPAVAPIATRKLEQAGVSDRVEFAAGDFFADPIPDADVIVLGNILHDWDESKKQYLIEKAYDALSPGGVMIAVENVIDDARRTNAFGLMMSLNMLIEFGAEGGFDYTGAQFDAWCRAAGFTHTQVTPLTGPSSAAIARK